MSELPKTGYHNRAQLLAAIAEATGKVSDSIAASAVAEETARTARHEKMAALRKMRHPTGQHGNTV